MSPVFVELSGESWELARAEATAAAQALGGGNAAFQTSGMERLIEVDLGVESAGPLAARLALAHRCLIPAVANPVGPTPPVGGGSTAAFRRFHGSSSGTEDTSIPTAARTWKGAGGRIDLEHPRHRFWLLTAADGSDQWLEEVAPIDRPATSARRISALPFQRPVGLSPRLARASANLARIQPGHRVVDPFVGTGALLAEAALLGARVVGVDRDPTMVQGALRNFAHLHVVAEELLVGDAGEVDVRDPDVPFDAVLSDLPYGRASGTGGEAVESLTARVIPRWAERVRPGGRVVLVMAGGADPLGPPWTRVLSIPVRVHRSLTREFRVYERSA